METIQIHEFDRQDVKLMMEIVSDKLREEGINTESFSFHIEVSYEKGEE